MTFLTELTVRLNGVIDAVMHDAAQLEFSRTQQQHLYCSALLCSNIRLTEGIRDSLRRRDEIGGYILLRSLMESFADLRNLAGDGTYIDYILAGFYNERRKMLANAIEHPDNIYFSEFELSPREDLRLVKEELSDLRRKGIKPLTIKEKFIKANMLDEYESAYALVCMHAHNNIIILKDRHFRIEDGQLGVYAFPGLSDDDAQEIAGKAAPFLVDSVAAVKRLVKEVEPTDLEPVRRALQKLQELWTPQKSWL